MIKAAPTAIGVFGTCKTTDLHHESVTSGLLNAGIMLISVGMFIVIIAYIENSQRTSYFFAFRCKKLNNVLALIKEARSALDHDLPHHCTRCVPHDGKLPERRTTATA